MSCTDPQPPNRSMRLLQRAHKPCNNCPVAACCSAPLAPAALHPGAPPPPHPHHQANALRRPRCCRDTVMMLHVHLSPLRLRTQNVRCDPQTAVPAQVAPACSSHAVAWCVQGGAVSTAAACVSDSAHASTTSDAVGSLSVAIIGGGMAGVATCRALAARGIACTLFEARPSVGGLWADNYPGARVQDNATQYAFPDMPFPAVADELATAGEVCGLCEAYVRRWKLEGHLRLSTRVERVSRRPGGGFAVAATAASGRMSNAAFTHVVVCTGTFSNRPRIPELPGLSRFEGAPPHHPTHPLNCSSDPYTHDPRGRPS